MADLLDREGYATKIANIGERMLLDPKFEVERYLEKVDSKIFGIDLHWCVHVQGAIKLARICKKVHPESLVVLGGLTATYYKEDIIQEYPFVDAVMTGESEEAMIELARVAGQAELDGVPNLTYRAGNGRLRKSESRSPPESLDKYEFTRVDLIEQPTEIFDVQAGDKKLKVWHLPICRGCLFNCATCGGSAYSYERLFSRERPAFRSVERIVEDFQSLDEQGFTSVFLFQDVRMGGDNYWERLLKTLHKHHWTSLEHVTMELFYPPEQKFLKMLQQFRPADKVALTMSPESGADHVRIAHGRDYSNGSIVKTADLCVGSDLPITFFFMGVLAQETRETVGHAVTLWEKLLGIKKGWVNVEYGPMIILDPGSRAFEHPEKEGYIIRNKTVLSHYEAASRPIWVDWINYETQNFNLEELKSVMLESLEQLIRLKLRYGRMGKKVAEAELKNLVFNRLILEEVKQLNDVENPEEKERRLREFKEIERDPLLLESYLLTHE